MEDFPVRKGIFGMLIGEESDGDVDTVAGCAEGNLRGYRDSECELETLRASGTELQARATEDGVGLESCSLGGWRSGEKSGNLGGAETPRLWVKASGLCLKIGVFLGIGPRGTGERSPRSVEGCGRGAE